MNYEFHISDPGDPTVGIFGEESHIIIEDDIPDDLTQEWKQIFSDHYDVPIKKVFSGKEWENVLENERRFFNDLEEKQGSIINQFKKDAKRLGRNFNSLSEFKLWFTAHKTVEFDKIMQEEKGFKSSNSYAILMMLRDKYKLNDKQITEFLKTYILNPSPEKDATYELDRTEGRPGTSYEEINDALVGMG